MTEKNIQVFPIFNQSAPGVWDDFLRIAAVAEEVNYNRKMTALDAAEVIKDYAATWRRYRHCFAFGAYDDAQMIGFVRGCYCERAATVHSLFVLPNFQGQHIGSKLLSRTETAGGVIARRMDLVSLGNSMPFYEKLGYTPICPNLPNHFVKDFARRTASSVMPIFRLTPKMLRECTKITSDINIDDVNIAHNPMFAYMDAAFNIDGFTVLKGNADPKIHVAKNVNRSFVHNCIANEVARYRAAMGNANMRQK